MAVGVALLPVTVSAAAEEKTFNSVLNLKIGETHRVGVFGQHRTDCMKSVNAEVKILMPPKIEGLKHVEGIEYDPRNSLNLVQWHSFY